MKWILIPLTAIFAFLRGVLPLSVQKRILIPLTAIFAFLRGVLPLSVQRILILTISIFAFLWGALPLSAQTNKEIYFFYGNGCPHCEIVEEYFQSEGLYDTYPIREKEIYFDRANAQLFNALMTSLNIPQEKRGVPTVVIGDTVLVGDQPIIDSFITEADTYLASDTDTSPISDTDTSPIADTKEMQKESEGSDLTLILVIAASLVDAINPCAFAVLVILMSTILVGGKPRKALYSGIAFSASIFISYFLMGLGIYKAIEVSGLSSGLIKIVGVLAIILGLFNLKDWLWYGKGFLMEVPMSWRPQLMKLIHSVTSPAGAFLIGFLVSLFLLPCTSGPYIVILGMLAERTFQFKAMLYLLLYNLVFITPMILITLLVYKGLDPDKVEKLRQQKLKTLHLIAGLILIGMGVFILLGWM